MAVKYSDVFGFISSFLVLPQFRFLGFGRELFNFALKHLQGRQIALDGVENRTAIYESAGFKGYFDVVTYSYVTGSVNQESSDIKTVNFEKSQTLLMDNEYVNHMVQNKEVNYKAIKKSSLTSSYAFTFKYRDGYKIHIESTDVNEAKTLFFRLTDEFKKGTIIYLQASKLTLLLLKIVQALHMNETSKFIRMYNKILD